MGIAAVTAVFATENVVDMVISKYVQPEIEVVWWVALAILSGWVLYELGEDRGDW